MSKSQLGLIGVLVGLLALFAVRADGQEPERQQFPIAKEAEASGRVVSYGEGFSTTFTLSKMPEGIENFGVEDRINDRVGRLLLAAVEKGWEVHVRYRYFDGHKGGTATFVGLAPVTTRTAADEPKRENKLVGTWLLVSAKYGGQDYEFPEGTTMHKHIAPTHFMWSTSDKHGTITRAAGGRYTLKGEEYVEKAEYGMGADVGVVTGKVHTFTCKLDGDTWHHDGKLENGLTIEEVWERVK